MASAEGFRRCDGFAGSVPQNFINANFPVCPLCGSKDPYWTLRDKIELTATRVQFRCKDCGGVLSATAMDFSGMTKSTAAALLTTAGGVNYLIKKHQGKDVKTVYMRVDDAGNAQTTRALEGKEMPIDELKRMAEGMANNAAVPPTRGYGSPAPGGTTSTGSSQPFTVSYGTDSGSYAGVNRPQAQPAQTTQTDSRPFGTPLAARILLYIAVGLEMFLLAYNIWQMARTGIRYYPVYTWISLILTPSAYAMLTVAISIRGKKISPLFGAGIMLLAVLSIISAISTFQSLARYSTRWTFANILSLVTSITRIVGAILIAVHYFTKGRGINHTVKTVFAIIICALAAVALVSNMTVIFRDSYYYRNVLYLITTLASPIVTLLLWLAIAIHAPFKRR